MAVSALLEKVSCSLILNNGTKDGKIKTLTVSIGGMNTQRYNDNKAMKIMNLMSECLSKPTLENRKTEVYTLSGEPEE